VVETNVARGSVLAHVRRLTLTAPDPKKGST
jgi:hypothetical protein